MGRINGTSRSTIFLDIYLLYLFNKNLKKRTVLQFTAFL